MEAREYAQMFALEEDHWWYRALRRRLLAELRRRGALGGARGGALVPPARPRYLDAGCGTGMTMSALGATAAGIGVDCSPLALDLARRRGLRHLVQASVEALPIAGESMDFVVSADVIYHRGVADDVAALREMARCLRPGGLLIINVPAFAWLHSTHDRAIHTARRYTVAQVRARLRSAGLTPLRVRYWNWLLFAPLAALRLSRRASARGATAPPGISPGASPAAAPPAAAPPTGVAAPESDLTACPRWLNTLLEALLRAEAALSWLPVPAGLSILAVARRGPYDA